MENHKDLMTSIDNLYEKYKSNKCQLNKSDTEQVAVFLVKLTNQKETTPEIIATELARFSADVCKSYFDKLLTNTILDAAVIDELIFALRNTDNGTKSQHYVQKYINAVVVIINWKPQELSCFKSIKPIINIILRDLDNDKKNQINSKNKFIALLNETNAVIYKLDYTADKKVDKKLIDCIRRLTIKFYNDIPSNYIALAKSWAEKNNVSISCDRINISASPNATDVKLAPELEEKNGNDIVKSDNRIANFCVNSKNNEKNTKGISDSSCSSATNNADEPASDFEKVLSRKSSEIINTFKATITPIETLIKQLQQDTNKAADNYATIEKLKDRIITLESTVRNLNTAIAEKDKDIMTKESENKEMSSKIEELKEKLNNAYSMVEHVNSQDTAKLKAELSQDLRFSYDMWTEYKESECNEDNFESLKIIVDELFRKIERKGIKIKE
ncbi:MAG: hypothetical protein J6A37_10735 [Oscillospiraceae bacterium]|nr:hypothetical protein [Oscillospiraceae bacterium]